MLIEKAYEQLLVKISKFASIYKSYRIEEVCKQWWHEECTAEEDNFPAKKLLIPLFF